MASLLALTIRLTVLARTSVDRVGAIHGQWREALEDAYILNFACPSALLLLCDSTTDVHCQSLFQLFLLLRVDLHISLHLNYTSVFGF